MTEIHSAFVSQVEPIEFHVLSGAFAELAGQEVAAGRATLHIGAPTGTGFAGTEYYGGTLRTGSFLVPSVKVEIVVSPWSSSRSEIGIRPLSSLGSFDSLRSNRFYSAARSVLRVAFDRLRGDLSTDDSAELVLAA